MIPFLFLFLLPSDAVFAQEGMHVSLTSLRNSKGHVLISIFREGEGFPDKAEKAFRKERVEIRDQTAEFTFTALPAGNYAIAVLHDENDDLKMNTNWLGIPKEGYGFSNNVTGTFGPPSYEKAKVQHAAGKKTVLNIKVRY